MEQFNVDSCPPYRALSYTWGPPSPTRTIALNGKQFQVRHNLWKFLCILQSRPEGEGFLWVDQLCIDQANIHERNHQVRLMEEIYRGAREVVVWLGISDAYTKEAIRFINRYVQDSPPSPTIVHSLRSLFTRSYWNRLWIVQEILLAPAIVVLCGGDKIDWMRLEEFVRGGRNRSGWWMKCRGIEDGNTIPSHISSFMHSSAFTSAFSKVKDNYTLATVIFLFSNNICADGRDKVYGLMGIVHRGERLVIDYNKSPQDVFLEACKVIITSGSSIPAFVELKSVGLKEFRDRFQQLGRGMNVKESTLERRLRRLERWFRRHKRFY